MVEAPGQTKAGPAASTIAIPACALIAALLLLLLAPAAKVDINQGARALVAGTRRSGIGSVPEHTLSLPALFSNGQASRCDYGSLPGTWSNGSDPGDKWQPLRRGCRLTNLLAEYAAAGRSAGGLRNATSLHKPDEPWFHSEVWASQAGEALAAARGVPVSLGTGAGTGAAAAAAAAGRWPSTGTPRPREVRVLTLTDSVERYLVAAVCYALGGLPHYVHADLPRADDGQALSPYNRTWSSVALCEADAPVKIATVYLRGVHPTGPYFRYAAGSNRQLVEFARRAWDEYAGVGAEPHLVIVASAFWDLARLHQHGSLPRRLVPSLPLAELDGWLSNFTDVVRLAQQAFPQAGMWATRTCTIPRLQDVKMGLTLENYLGRRYYIQQLNAAAAEAAQQLGLHLIDYAMMAEFFSGNEEHLVDDVHPSSVLLLEIFNVVLNLVHQHLDTSTP